MDYMNFIKKVNTTEDIKKYKKLFEEDIVKKQKELINFISEAEKRVKWVCQCEVEHNYKILGHMCRNGKNKYIMLIKRYPDGSQSEEKYEYGKIKDCREKLKELQEKYNGVDWSQFTNELDKI